MSGRVLPNILITGTPGTGKSTLCEQLIEHLGPVSNNVTFQHLALGQCIKDHTLYNEFDDDLGVPIFDEDKVLDFLEGDEDLKSLGGRLIDFHSADFFPPSWLDLVVVLRANTETIYDRLQQRGYPKGKLEENVQSEIFQVILDEVKDAFQEHVEIWEEQHNTLEDMSALIEKIKAFVTSKA